jgi:hypothetical protein
MAISVGVFLTDTTDPTPFLSLRTYRICPALASTKMAITAA